MKAYMSNPDAGVRNLRPDLYAADRTWLERVAFAEAQRILSETEPTIIRAGRYHDTDHHTVFGITTTLTLPSGATFQATERTVSFGPFDALAEALAAFVGEERRQ